MVVCDNIEQVEQIVEAGKSRGEMRSVRYRGTTEPYYNKRNYLVTEVHFNDLGPAWTGEDDSDDLSAA